jgi:outer membrane protein TolC
MNGYAEQADIRNKQMLNAKNQIANTMSNISNVAGGNSTLLDKLILPFTQEKPTGLPKGTPIKLGSK